MARTGQHPWLSPGRKILPTAQTPTVSAVSGVRIIALGVGVRIYDTLDIDCCREPSRRTARSFNFRKNALIDYFHVNAVISPEVLSKELIELS